MFTKKQPYSLDYKIFPWVTELVCQEEETISFHFQKNQTFINQKSGWIQSRSSLFTLIGSMKV